MTPPKIVIINDEPAILLVFDTVLTRAGYDTHLCTQGTGPYHVIRQITLDLVILDLTLEHPQAGEAVLELLDHDPATAGIPIIVCSGDTYALQANSQRWQAQGYHLIAKPFELADLLELVHRALTERGTSSLGAGG